MFNITTPNKKTMAIRPNKNIMTLNPNFTRPMSMEEITQYSTKIEKSENPLGLQDLIQEAEISIRWAYERGKEEGSQANNLSFVTKGDLLKAFDSYVIKYIRLTGDEEGAIFVPRQPDGMRLGITLDTLIKNFLLSYDND